MPNMLPLQSLRPHPHNPRKHVVLDYITELAGSLRESGQWDAILVRPLPDGAYQIIAGHCRVEAARSLNWADIRAEIREMTEEEADFLLLDTNLKRRSLSELEEAQAIHRMITDHGWTQAKAADAFGKTQQWISLRLRLLGLAPEVQQAVTNRFVSATAATHIAQAPAEMQPALVRKVQEGDLSTRETERLVKVATDPAVPEDVKRAVLDKPTVTPAHAEAIAKAPTAFQREGLLRAAERGQITPQEAESEAAAARQWAERPPTIAGAKAQRRLNVFQHLTKARTTLDEIAAQDVYDLDADDLRDAERVLGELAAQLAKINRLVEVAQSKGANQQPKGLAKVHRFPGTH